MVQSYYTFNLHSGFMHTQFFMSVLSTAEARLHSKETTKSETHWAVVIALDASSEVFTEVEIHISDVLGCDTIAREVGNNSPEEHIAYISTLKLKGVCSFETPTGP